MDSKLRLMEEDMQKLGNMNQTLFSVWQDKMSEVFANGCVGVMEQKWKEYIQTVEPLIRQINKIEHEMNDLRERCKKR